MAFKKFIEKYITFTFWKSPTEGNVSKYGTIVMIKVDETLILCITVHVNVFMSYICNGIVALSCKDVNFDS